MNTINYLFVCYGNTCRSPMAVALARQKISKKSFIKNTLKITIDSAGIAPSKLLASLNAIKVMQKNYKLTIDLHVPKSVNDLPLSNYTQIIALDEQVHSYLWAKFPQIQNRLIKWNINDPYGKEEEVYANCAKLIKQNIDAMDF